MNLSLFLFLIGILGFILNRKNIILMIIAIEIMLLAVNNSSLSSILLPEDSENKSKKGNVSVSTKSFVLSIASIGSNVNKHSTYSSLRHNVYFFFSSIISTIFKKFKKVGNRITIKLFTQYFYNLPTLWVNCKNKLMGQFFIFPMIINNVSSNVPSDSDSLVRFCLASFILLLLGLFSFISIIGYFVSFYLLQKYDIYTKYPKFVRIIKYYEKMSLYHVIFQIIICLFVYVFLITINLILIGYIKG